jgi:ELWxxDGT repeat protein
MGTALAMTGAAVAAAPAAPGSVETVADVVAASSGRFGDPDDLTDVGGTLFFTARYGAHGRDVWTSDGTTAGTILVKDITCDSCYDADYGYPYDLTAVGGSLFFTEIDDTHGRELWTSDGTRAGTVVVKDIYPGGYSYGSDPDDLVSVGGTLFFSADDGTHGRELWASDGTTAGTVLVKDLNPNSRRGIPQSGYPSDLADVGGTLFFSAADGAHGRELWASDGTTAGTVLVKDINPNSNSGAPSYLADVGGTLFFTADDGVHGRELWTSDGTTAGTFLVKDINPSPYGEGYDNPSDLTDVGGTLFFSAVDGVHGRELWTSDGTGAGTVLVKDINPGRSSGASTGYGDAYGLTGVGGTLFFAGDDGTHGGELWTSDGTGAGTVLVKDINPSDYAYAPSGLTDVGGTLFFTADDGTHGRELWTSDGTGAGTVLVKDIKPDNGYYGPSGLTGVGATLFFAADHDGRHGDELWTSDGTPAGTVLVKDFTPPSNKFALPRAGKANTTTGTVTLTITLPGPGTLRLGPVADSMVKKTTKPVSAVGKTTITLKPTRAGLRELKHRLRQARHEGKQVGRLPVKARFTFTPTGGTANSRTAAYTLKLK